MYEWRIVGIDPGKDGGLGCLTSDGQAFAMGTPMIKTKRPGKNGKIKTVEIYDVPAMRQLLLHAGPTLVVLEQVHAMPGQGVTSMFSMGHGLGLWEGLLGGMQIPFIYAAPQEWMRLVLAGFGIKDKNVSYTVASRMYPHLNLKGAKGGIRDGQADAICIAEYGKRIHYGGNSAQLK